MTGIADPFLSAGSDTAKSGTTWGSIIPISWGRRQIDGKAIWCGALRTDGQGNNIADFAVCFGRSIIPPAERQFTQLLKLWADGTVVYDATDAANPGFTDVVFSFHPGLTDADADATIAADQGELTPGFRGLIYIVFKDFPLWRLGAAATLPTVRGELSDVASVTNSATQFAETDGLKPSQSTFIVADYKQAGGLLYTVSGSPADTIKEYSIDGQEELRRGTVPGLLPDLLQVHDKTNRLLFTVTSTDNTEPIRCISLDSLSLIGTFGVASGAFHMDASGFILMRKGTPLHWRRSGVDYYGAAFGSFDKSVGFLAYTHSSYDVGGKVGVSTEGGPVLGGDIDFRFLGTFDVASRTIIVLGGAIGPLLDYPLAGRGDLVSKFNVADNARQDFYCFFGTYEQVWVVRGNSDGVGTPMEFFFYAPGLQVVELMFDDSDGGIVVFLSDGAQLYISKMTIEVKQSDDGTGLKPSLSQVLYIKPLDANDLGSVREARIVGGLLAVSATTAKYNVVDLSTGNSVYYSADATNFWSVGSPFVWDGKTGTAFLPRAGGGVPLDGTIALRFNTGTLGTVRLDDSIRWLCTEAGYDPSEVFTSGIDDTIFGGIITATTDMGTIALNLAAVFDFQFFESDGRLKFVRQAQGDEAVASYALTSRDLAMSESGGGDSPNADSESLLTEQAAPDEVPRAVQISYIDINFDYGPNAQTFVRPQFPVRTSQGNTAKSYAVPIIMTGQDVYGRAARLAYQLYAESEAQYFRLPFRFARLEPSDVVTLALGAYSFTLKMVEMVFNADWSISATALNHDYKTDVEVVGGPPLGRVEQQTTGASDSIPLALDVPLLRQADEPVGEQTGIYAGAASYDQPWWRHADVYAEFAASGVVEFEGRDDAAVPLGIAGNVLPDVVNTWRTHDEVALLLVSRSIAAADLASAANDEDFRAGKNALLVGQDGRWECVYFRNVTQTGPRTFTLDTLLRGRRGTEIHCGTHQVGDRVVLLQSNGARSELLVALTDGTNRGKSVVVTARGDATSGTVPRAAITMGAGGTAAPWTVQQIAGVHSGSDVVLTWLRRSRWDSELHDLDPDTPLAEDSESYDLEIYSGPGGTLKRTVAGIGSPTYTYLAADQVADGFTAPAPSITLRIYQNSARVGRGLVEETTINVG